MNYEFVYEEDFLIIKLSGSAEVNERLLTKESLTSLPSTTTPKSDYRSGEPGGK